MLVSDLLEYRLPKGSANNNSLDYESMSRVVQALYQTVADNDDIAEGDSNDGVLSRFLEKVTAIFN